MSLINGPCPNKWAMTVCLYTSVCLCVLLCKDLCLCVLLCKDLCSYLPRLSLCFYSLDD